MRTSHSMIVRKKYKLLIGRRTIVLGERTLVMGVLNVTPDSFSDGGKFFRVSDEVKAGLAMERAGADILDSVAEAALDAGAEMLNDISGLKQDPKIAEVAARFGVPLILMHMRGTPRTMQKQPWARDVVKDVTAGLRESVAVARRAGVRKSQIILDPGIGFGKSFAQNYELLAKLPALAG